jgi:hypothetical protein
LAALRLEALDLNFSFLFAPSKDSADPLRRLPSALF